MVPTTGSPTMNVGALRFPYKWSCPMPGDKYVHVVIGAELIKNALEFGCQALLVFSKIFWKLRPQLKPLIYVHPLGRARLLMVTGGVPVIGFPFLDAEDSGFPLR